MNAIVSSKNLSVWTNFLRLVRPALTLFVPAYGPVACSVRLIPIQQALNEVFELTVIDRFCDVSVATSRERLGVKIHRVVC